VTNQKVLGINCFSGDLSSAVETVIDRAQAGKGGTVCLANVHVIVTGQRDPILRDALRDAWLVLPDGAPIAWAQRREGKKAERIAGADLMLAVMDRGRRSNIRHFLFGATPEVLSRLEANLLEYCPGVQIVGTYAPPRAEEDAPTSLRPIANARPHIVWTALGAPKQEIWAERHRSTVEPAVIISVGAAFDFHAGNKRRAPRWMQSLGLEWLYRLGQEPRRLWRRYMSTNLRFMMLYTVDRLRRPVR
jgi:N-acetylglucosaminyldiphosphoundecaprenol N-acetyl-beta-D-mannosaminyltransferase